MKSIVKCILLDDDLQGLEYIKLLCQKIDGVEVVKCYTDPADFLSGKDQFDFDVCILDIDMPELNGLQIAQLLPGKPVIFVTAHSRFAADAFDLNAVDFVRKPIRIDRLEASIQKAREKIEKKGARDSIGIFMTDKGKMLIPYDEIAYISTPEREKRDKYLYTTDGAVHRIKNISLILLLKQLPPGFVQINKREIVAVPMVKYIQHDALILKPFRQGEKQITLTIGPKFRESFYDAIY